MVNKEIDIVSSFLAGFGTRDDSDIINGLFIALNILGIESPFNFESRGCLGVESKEIRRILNYDKPLENKGDNKVLFNAGRFLSKLSSDEIAWVAQYLKNGKVHLYPKEVKRAEEILSEFMVNRGET